MYDDKPKILKQEYVKAFKFDIPVDPKNLTRMIHPHFGYLSLFPVSNYYNSAI